MPGRAEKVVPDRARRSLTWRGRPSALSRTHATSRRRAPAGDGRVPLPISGTASPAKACDDLVRRLCERRLFRFRDRDIALPTFVLKLDVLNRNGIRVCVEVRQCLILRDPAAIDLVSNYELAGLVVHLEEDVFAKIRQRDFHAKTCAIVPHLVCPLLEGDILRDPAIQTDCVVFGAARRLATGAGVTAVTVLDHLGGALQHADLADARDIFTVPLQTELEVFVGIDASRIGDECWHCDRSSNL